MGLTHIHTAHRPQLSKSSAHIHTFQRKLMIKTNNVWRLTRFSWVYVTSLVLQLRPLLNDSICYLSKVAVHWLMKDFLPQSVKHCVRYVQVTLGKIRNTITLWLRCKLILAHTDTLTTVYTVFPINELCYGSPP